MVASMFAGARVLAGDVESTFHDGKFVSATDGNLVMSSKDGKKHSHSLTKDAKVTLDGKNCKASDLKAGAKIRVTTKPNDVKIATTIEAIDKNELFANTHDGKFVSLEGDKLVMTESKGKEEQTRTTIAEVKVTCDGEVCKASDLKPGMRIRVTTQSKDPHAAIQIEALKDNPEFASI